MMRANTRANSLMNARHYIFAFLLAALPVSAQDTNTPPDLNRDRVAYLIGYSHLDTQWRWTYPQTIGEFIPKTVSENEPLFPKYPHYVFNWTGANRYRFMKEFHPADFAKVKAWVAAGRWYPAGSS